MVVVAIFMVIAASSLISWAVTGVDPYLRVDLALTGSAAVKKIYNFDDQGNVKDSREVYRLGSPGALKSCMSRLAESEEEMLLEDYSEGGSLVSWFRCVQP